MRVIEFLVSVKYMNIYVLAMGCKVCVVLVVLLRRGIAMTSAGPRFFFGKVFCSIARSSPLAALLLELDSFPAGIDF